MYEPIDVVVHKSATPKLCYSLSGVGRAAAWRLAKVCTYRHYARSAVSQPHCSELGIRDLEQRSVSA